MSEKPPQYTLPATLKELQASNPFGRNFWETYDDSNHYDIKLKYKFLVKYLEESGIEVGPVIFDIGAGELPLSQYAISEENAQRTVFAVDFLKPFEEMSHHIDADVNALLYPKSTAYKRGLIKIASMLGIDPREADKKQVDVIVFSDILNYVPYREVITACVQFLKKDGIIVIFNQPGRTFADFQGNLPSYGVQNNDELAAFLSEPHLGLTFLHSSLDTFKDYPDEDAEHAKLVPVFFVLQKK